jgi:membrane protein YqaA with SNARE-associated domain
MQSRRSFFLRHLLTGLVWLSIIIALFVFTKHNVDRDLLIRFEHLFDNTLLILIIFVISELFIGIIPPEFFFIWALKNGNLSVYISYIILLAVLSYFAGLAGFFFGRYLNTTRLYRYLHNRFLQKTESFLNQYGLYLIVVASLTPVPFSGTAMLTGAVKYPAKNYALWSLTRFVKFALVGWVIWEANMI